MKASSISWNENQGQFADKMMFFQLNSYLKILESMRIIVEMPVYVSFVVEIPVKISNPGECCNRSYSIHFSIAPSLPTGLFLDSSTGDFYGRPETCSGPRMYTLICRGADGATVSKGVILEVTPLTQPIDDTIVAANKTQSDHELFDKFKGRYRSDLNYQSARYLASSTNVTNPFMPCPDRSPAPTAATYLAPRCRSPSPLRSAADAAVLLPLGPRLMLALCDGDEARRVMRARRMGRAAFIAAGAAMEGSVRRNLSSPRQCQLSVSRQRYQLTVPPHQCQLTGCPCQFAPNQTASGRAGREHSAARPHACLSPKPLPPRPCSPRPSAPTTAAPPH